MMEVGHMKKRSRNKKGGKWRKTLIIGTIALILIAIPMIGVSGFSSFNKKLPDEGANFSCSTCHCGNELNEFGVEFMENDNKYDTVLAARDSDGDNFTNEEEFDAVVPTNPGDALSYPNSNETSNITGITRQDTSAFLGPIDMKAFVETFYTIIIPLMVGAMAVLVIMEGIHFANLKLKSRKKVTEESGEHEE
jgi:hypothetical protein